MPKQNVMETTLDAVLEAQEKAEDTYRQALEDLFDAANGTLRQTRSASAAIPAVMPLFDLQEKALENSRVAAKTAFDNYRRTVAEPMRKLARESAAKLAPKAHA